MQINCAGMQRYSAVNGPGLRSVIWTQGCPIRCRGCFNKELWSFSGGMAVEPVDLADQILGTPGIEGVTFSGGEPFCQAESVARCAGILKEQGLNTVTFTGYTYDHIRKKGRKSWDALLGVTDLLIAGPYIQELHCPEPLRSSRNQELVHLSGLLAGRVDEYRNGGQPVEYSILPGGEVTITGFPEKRMRAGSFRTEGDPCLISLG